MKSEIHRDHCQGSEYIENEVTYSHVVLYMKANSILMSQFTTLVRMAGGGVHAHTWRVIAVTHWPEKLRSKLI